MMRELLRYDFYIVTAPVSGSHMLASALDSHPDIQCRGEYGFKDYADDLGAVSKRVKGCITHIKHWNFRHVHQGDVDKFIVLGRHGKEQMLAEVCYPRPTLVLTYEDLTKDKNISRLPTKYANQICDFLDVKREQLKPSFVKGVGLVKETA